MIINVKKIEHERLEDAPFIGALICAVDCNINCTDCFNQEIKDLPTIQRDSKDIINEVLSNPFNKGVILAGLEWTLQVDEMRELIKLALENSLEVILYTGLDIEVFKNKFPDVYKTKGIYIKFGRYKEELKIDDYYEYGVKLASINQAIYKMEEQY